jgi:hypothetical protein
MNKPWINFEAGALSKAVGTESRVIPLLIDLGNSDLVGPLNQFQTVLPTKEDMRKLVDAINISTGKPNPPEVVSRVFKAMWGEFEAQMNEIQAKGNQPSLRSSPRTEHEMLQELVELTRDIRRSVKAGINRQPAPGQRELPDGGPVERAAVEYIQKVLDEIPEAAPNLDWMIQYHGGRIHVFILEESSEQIETIAEEITSRSREAGIPVSVEIAQGPGRRN